MHTNNLSSILTVIHVSGDDAATFLQGQLTNDITLLDDAKTTYQFAAHLNHKGRMLASFIVIKISSENYYLITSREIVVTIIPRLKMFVLRSKVNIQALEKTITLSNTLATANVDNDEHISIRLNANHYLSITETNNIDDTAVDTSDSLKMWKEFLISTNIPVIYPTTMEILIPQQVNYDLLPGISYNKGCYTGQEIVARTHYLGKVKRRMFKFQIKQPVTIGQTIVSPTMNNQAVGVIVECSTLDQQNSHGLVSLQTDCIDTAFLDKENQFQLIITTENIQGNDH